MDNKKILIIEDEVIIALYLQSILERNGYEVCDIGISADKAITLTEKHLPDLILMDIFLDGENDGVFAVVEINKKHNIPVIYCTANTDEKIFEKAMKTKPYGYLMKPLDKHELLSTIEIALDKHGEEIKQ